MGTVGGGSRDPTVNTVNTVIHLVMLLRFERKGKKKLSDPWKPPSRRFKVFAFLRSVLIRFPAMTQVMMIMMMMDVIACECHHEAPAV